MPVMLWMDIPYQHVYHLAQCIEVDARNAAASRTRAVLHTYPHLDSGIFHIDVSIRKVS